MEKVCTIFIDGGYLGSFLKKNNNFRLDYLKLSNKISKIIDAERLRTYYYDCLPILKEENKIHYQKKKRFINKLMQLPRFEVKLGELQLQYLRLGKYL